MRTRHMKRLTAELLRELLVYDQESGLFTWKKKRSGVPHDNAAAGTLTKAGYIQICIHNRLYRAHRLAWLWMTGEWPASQLDHENRVRSDNRWKNLRLASPLQNRANLSMRSNNTTGYKGIAFISGHKRPWRAMIGVNGVAIFLGLFATKEEAAAAYDAAALEHFGEFAATNARLRSEAA